ncbi:condensation domain-containing protein [Streptomyces sp. cg40]|uniref:condensation domain-containing protein n=1 Tax=Streptomyces sp. cg40 TaxID=3419764 RepID=UPI003D03F34C
MRDDEHDATPIDLTESQVRRWRAARASDGLADQISPTYLIQDEVDPLLLSRAVAAVVRRHAPLRTRVIPGPDEAPRATLRAAPVTFPIHTVRLTGLPEDRRAAVCAQLGARDSAIRVDLESHWPLRVTLITLEAELHLLLLTVSHIVADGWSCGVLVREIQDSYRELANGEAAPAEPDTKADGGWAAYVSERAERDRSGWSSRDLPWWRTHLSGVSSGLWTGGETPAPRSTSALDMPFTLPENTGTGLRRLANSLGTTTYTITLAVLAAALAQRSGAGEAIISVPYAGRDEEEHEALVGLFANRVLLRVPVDRAAPFPRLVERAQDTLLDSLDHAGTPFHLVKDALSEGSHQDAPDLDDVAPVSLQVYPRSMCDAEPNHPGDLPFRLLGFRTAALPRALALYLIEPDDGPASGWLTHRPSLMSPGEAIEFLTFLSRVLAAAVREPEHTVAELLSTAETNGEIDPLEDAATPWGRDNWVTGTSGLTE